MKYYEDIQKIISKIDFQQFRPVWYTVGIIKEQNLPIKVYQKDWIAKHMHDYFAGYISYDEMIKEVSKIEKEYNFKFDWNKFPKDFRELKIKKLLNAKQIYPKHDEHYYDSNPNLIQVFDELNELLSLDIPHQKWVLYTLSKWRKFPSLNPISAYDVICSLISYDMLDNKSYAKKVVQKLELTEEDYIYFDYEDYMDNVIFGDVNKKVS